MEDIPKYILVSFSGTLYISLPESHMLRAGISRPDPQRFRPGPVRPVGD